MNTEQIYATNKPRQAVWVTSDRLTAGETVGTYEFVDPDDAAGLGFAAEIIVIDQQMKLLFWDPELGAAWDWTREEA